MVSSVQQQSVSTPLSLRSSYLKYLPAIYSESDFMGRFLMIFEDVLGPVEEMLENLAYYFSPGLAAEELLPWLASWLDLLLDETWPLERRRDLIKGAVELYRWRGTKKGLRDYLRTYTGVEPLITEGFGSLTLGEHSRLGWNSILGDRDSQFTFAVTLEVDDPTSFNLSQIRSIVEAEKPAYCSYTLEIIASADGNGT